MKPLKALRALYEFVTALEIELLRPELIYALPLVSYLTLIVLLFAFLLPTTWRDVSKNISERRRWQVPGSSDVDGKLLAISRKGDQTRTVMIDEGQGVRTVPFQALSKEDQQFVEVHGARLPGSQHPRIFFALAFISFGVTWTYMLQYFALSFATYASSHVTKRIALSPLSAINVVRKPGDLTSMPLLWLRDVSLFDEAWSVVCSDKARWLLSSQLCLFAVTAFAPFVILSTYQRKGQKVTVLVLGQIVAISVATALHMRIPRRAARRASMLIWPSLIGATLLTGALPKVVGTKMFLPVLLGLHALLFAPLLPIWQLPRAQLRLDYLFFALAFLASVVHLEALISVQLANSRFSYIQLLTGDVKPQWTRDTALNTFRAVRDAFLAHPAQGSIGSDAILCALIFMLSRIQAGGWLVPLLIALPTPFVGLGTMGAITLALAERSVVERMKMMSDLE